MDNNETIYDVNIEDTNIIPVPTETRKILNKKLIKEDPLKPYKKINNLKIILLVFLFVIVVFIITSIIYKMVIS